MIGGAKGVIRSMLCDGDLKSECIPVDYAINGLIVVPVEFVSMKTRPKQIPVYNITCSEDKRVTWRWIMEHGRKFALENPFEVGLWYPDGNMTMNYYYHWFCVIFFMWLPAYLIDFLLLIFGQKRFMLRVQTKIQVGLEVLQFFTTRNWDFKSYNYSRLWGELSERDKEIFNMNMDVVSNEEYLKTAILGGRQYVCKEPLSSLPRARIQIKILYVLDRVCKAIFLYYTLSWLITKLGIADWYHREYSADVMQNMKVI